MGVVAMNEVELLFPYLKNTIGVVNNSSNLA
jgi:hypothetical protein